MAPTNVVATRGDTEAHVDWDEPSLHFNLLGGLVSLTDYVVTAYRAADDTLIKAVDAGHDTEVTVTGLQNGTPVYFTVTADTQPLGIELPLGLRPFEGVSSPSNTVIPAGPPFAPTDVVATRGESRRST